MYINPHLSISESLKYILYMKQSEQMTAKYSLSLSLSLCERVCFRPTGYIMHT